MSTTSASGWAPTLAETLKLPSMQAFSTRMLSSIDCVVLHVTSTVMQRLACAEACSLMLLLRIWEPFPTSARIVAGLCPQSLSCLVALSCARARASGGSPATALACRLGWDAALAGDPDQVRVVREWLHVMGRIRGREWRARGQRDGWRRAPAAQPRLCRSLIAKKKPTP